MLTRIFVQDFAIIDRLELRFSPGFNVITGETGAGKSIVIDALDLLLGGKADPDMVRAGAEVARVEGEFDLEAAVREPLDAFLARESLESDEPGLLVLGREVRRNGRHTGRINGRAVNRALLQEAGQLLVDIHGQSEHLSLLRVREHIHLLDRYANLDPARREVSDLVRRLQEVRRELHDLIRDERQLARRADLLRFQIDEISAARLKPGEEATLTEERNRLANAEQLAALSTEAYGLLAEGAEQQPSVTDLLGQIIKSVNGLAKLDPSVLETLQTAESAAYGLAEVAGFLRDYQDNIEYNPRRLNALEERLETLKRLKKKYGDSIEEILAYADTCAAELDTISHSEERVASLQEAERDLLVQIGQKAATLSLARRQAAARLGKAVEQHLADLRMSGARFAVDVRWEEDADGAPVPSQADRPASLLAGNGPSSNGTSAGRYGFDSTGIDRVEFLVAPNPGEGLKPMVKIASGGETARLMLALKTVLSQADQTPTLVFDEIDQGIGGRVGSVVGQKLWALTHSHQVLCITHLPQLAGFGDAHFRVQKVVRNNRTTTEVRQLDIAERIEELAQMLGTAHEAGVYGAREILNSVAAVKSAAPA